MESFRGLIPGRIGLGPRWPGVVAALLAVTLSPTSRMESLRTLCGGKGGDLYDLAVSPDESTLFAVHGEPMVETLDIRKGKQVSAFPLPAGPVVLSADGRQEAIGVYRDIEIWDLRARRCLVTCRGHAFTVIALALAPDGRRVASLSFGDPGVWVWELATGQVVATLKHADRGGHLRFSPDGRTLATQDCIGEDKYAIKLWETASWRTRAILPTGSTSFAPHSFSSDSTRLLVDDPTEARLLDLRTGRTVRRWKLAKKGWMHPDVWLEAISLEAGLLLSTAADGRAIVWSTRTAEPVVVVQRKGEIVHKGIFSPSGRRLFVTEGNTIKVWKIARKEQEGKAVPMGKADRECIDDWRRKYSLYIMEAGD